jgi:hypothetical protein
MYVFNAYQASSTRTLRIEMSLSQYTTDSSRTIIHRTVELPIDWYEFVTRFEHRLGRFDAVALDAARTLQEMEAAVLGMRKKEPFSIYAIYDHGVLSTLAGKNRRGKQYIIGNSALATTMTVFDIRVGQNLPIQIMIHEVRPGFTTIEFESAVSHLSALSEGNEEVVIRAADIDEFRECVILKIFEDAKAGRAGGNGL